MKTRLLLLLGLVACGDDGPTDNTVTLHALGTKLLAVQQDGAWKTVPVPAGTGGDATLAIHGPFVVASVCDEPGFFDYYLSYGGPGIDEIHLECAPPLDTVQVSLAMGSTVKAAVGPYPLYDGWSWDVPPGTYDVVAYDDSLVPPRFEIRRGVSITADTVLTFNLATTGTSLEMFTVTTDALTTEGVDVRSRIMTAGGARLSFGTNDARAWRVPASALQTGDRQLVTASASRDPSYRSTTRAITAQASLMLTLPAPLTSATPKPSPAIGAAWQSSTAWTDGYFYMADPQFAKLYDAQVYPEWVAATDTFTSIELPDPAQLPGWQSAWNVTSMAGYDWSLSLRAERSEVDADGAGWYDTLPALRAAPIRSHTELLARVRSPE